MNKHEEVEQRLEDVFVNRVGKVDTLETYSNSIEFLMMFPNDYSIIARRRSETDKYAKVELYHGIGEVTYKFFKSKRASRKVSRKIVLSLIKKLPEIKENEDL